jgi:hypothetical protein
MVVCVPGEAYELLDDILRFAARRSARRRSGIPEANDDDTLLAAAV